MNLLTLLEVAGLNGPTSLTLQFLGHYSTMALGYTYKSLQSLVSCNDDEVCCWKDFVLRVLCDAGTKKICVEDKACSTT